MTDLINNPNSQCAHFILAQRHIYKHGNGAGFDAYNNNFTEYDTSGNPIIPTKALFSNGYVLNSKNTYGWYNVDFKTILGDLYYKYDNFYLCLNSIYSTCESTITGNATLASAYRQYNIKINGLPFENIKNNKEVIFNSNQLVYTTNQASVIYPSRQYFKFSKVSNATIEIRLHYIFNDNQSDPNVFYGVHLLLYSAFGFSIFPCKD